ncbi:radical SAM protein [Intestinibacillus sp. Marseille-P6563]|uniref:radical SAM protein n=1 Tax=Intestinibacillus sp. Marseille-P6563 TaxID=2364792 RepID=UPI002ED63445
MWYGARTLINYVPVKKVRSCMLLQKALIYDKNGDLRFCWQPSYPFIPSSDPIDASAFLQLRNSLLQNIENGTATNTPCDGCSRVQEDYYPVKPLSWSINYFCHGICNYKCSYCTLRNHVEMEQQQGNHSLKDLIQTFQNTGLLGEDYGVCLSTAGEPSIHPDRKEFYQAANGTELIVNTNGFVFDEDLYETMNQKKVLLICSVDCGTSETYHKIKGVDGFARMKQNLSHYAQAPFGIVALKYIFVPGLNDTLEDVDGFIKLCVEVNTTFVLVAMDYFSVNEISEHTRNMITHLNQKLLDFNILCIPYTGYETAEYGNMMRELLK